MQKKFLRTFPVLLICRRLRKNVVLYSSLLLLNNSFANAMGSDYPWIDEEQPIYRIYHAGLEEVNRMKRECDGDWVVERGVGRWINAKPKSACPHCIRYQTLCQERDEGMIRIQHPEATYPKYNLSQIDSLINCYKSKQEQIDSVHKNRRSGIERSLCKDSSCFLCSEYRKLVSNLEEGYRNRAVAWDVMFPKQTKKDSSSDEEFEPRRGGNYRVTVGVDIPIGGCTLQ